MALRRETSVFLKVPLDFNYLHFVFCMPDNHLGDTAKPSYLLIDARWDGIKNLGINNVLPKVS